MIQIIHLKVCQDYTLFIELSSGKKGHFDVKRFWDKGYFNELKNYEYFAQVQNRGRSIFWPHEQDFSADTIEVLLNENGP